MASITRVNRGARLRAERARAGVKRDEADGGIVMDAGGCRSLWPDYRLMLGEDCTRNSPSFMLARYIHGHLMVSIIRKVAAAAR